MRTHLSHVLSTPTSNDTSKLPDITPPPPSVFSPTTPINLRNTNIQSHIPQPSTITSSTISSSTLATSIPIQQPPQQKLLPLSSATAVTTIHPSTSQLGALRQHSTNLISLPFSSKLLLNLILPLRKATAIPSLNTLTNPNIIPLYS